MGRLRKNYARSAGWIAALVVIGSVLAGCGDGDDLPVPTVASWPTLPPTATAPPTRTPTPLPSATATASPTPTATATFTPSATPTATATFTPSATSTPSNTPFPSPTSTITPVQIAITNGIGANVRSGPDVLYPVIVEMPADATFNAIAYATNAAGDVWYLIELKGGGAGWISSVVAGRVDDVPLGLIALAATVPASPTPSPTLTPTVTFTPSPSPTLPVGANARITVESRVNLRSGPGTTHGALGLLNPLAPLKLIGRNSATSWFYVNTFDGRTGWVFGDLVDVVAIDAGALPVSWTEPVVAISGPVGGAVIPSGPGGGSLNGSVLANVRTIYQRGQARGNRPNSFIVIGDSVSARSPEWTPFFYAFQFGSYDLGHSPHLQTTVDYYRATGSFGGDYQTARAGFATHFLLDGVWADPAMCLPGETPIDCEYRVKMPSIAIVYLGLMDMQISTIAAYQQNMHTIIQMLLDRGVIPVLNTVTLADNSEIHQRHGADMDQINAIVRSMAASYQIPLIDFERAAYPLPNQGCLPDGAHLSYRADGVTSFNGDEQVYGKELREYLTLKMLDDLRVYVFGG